MSILSRSKHRANPNQPRKQLILPGVRINPSGRWLAPYSADQADELAAQLAKLDASEVTVTISALQKWSRDFRIRAFTAIQSSGVGIITVEGNVSIRRTVFDAVLEYVQSYEGFVEKTAIREAICEAIALLEPAQHEEAINVARQTYKDQGLKAPNLSWFRDRLRNLTFIVDNGSGGDNSPQTFARGYLAALREAEDSDDEDVPWLRRRNGKWLRYNGQIYREVTDEAVECDLVQKLQSDTSAVKITKPLVRDVLLNLQALCILDDLPECDSILISRDSAAEVSPYIACANGLLDLRPILVGESESPVLYGFTPRHFSPIQLGFEYHPEAKCPVYDQFINQVLPARDDGDRRIQRLEQFIAWVLSPPALRLEKAAVLIGNGANGKSTALNVFTKLIGATNVSHVALQDLGNRFRPAQLVGKLANISNDMSRVERFEEGTFKQLVSGDPLQFERKGQDPETIYSNAKLIFATNHLPAINDRTEGTARKLMIIPFQESFPEKKADKLLDAKLAQELPGIANRLFRALASLVRARRFAECSVCARVEASFRVDNDPFVQFFDEHCQINKLAAIGLKELYRHYVHYCLDNGRRAVNSSEFAHRVEEKTGMSTKRPGSKGPRQRVLPGIQYVDHVRRD
ncbi:phage/plasmid primase, P4 family [Anatilimnocola sp. NA78]|uniref:DNA primase family protein n=1 Tax=Anatilimnocola sp. NA78 TaxID=3415683 RepID=UPI003CE5535C